MVTPEGRCGSINYLGVSPDLQHRAIGRRIMEEAEKKLEGVGCPKINLQVRASNEEVIEFYKRLRYSIDDGVSMGKRLSPARPGDADVSERDSD